MNISFLRPAAGALLSVATWAALPVAAAGTQPIPASYQSKPPTGQSNPAKAPGSKKKFPGIGLGTGKVDSLTYDLKSRRFKEQEGILEVRGIAGHLMYIKVTSLNPLYRLKATYTTLVIDYGTPNDFLIGNPVKYIKSRPPGATTVPKTTQADVEAFMEQAQKSLDLARAYRASFEQVRGLSRQVVLDSTTTVQALYRAVRAVKLNSAGLVPADILDGFRETRNVLTQQQATGTALQTKLDPNNINPEIEPAVLSRFKLSLQAVEDLGGDLDSLAAKDEFRSFPAYWVAMMSRKYSSDTRNNPLLLSGDQVLVKLDVVRRSEFDKLPAADFSPLAFTIQVVRGLHVDFSAGLVFNRLQDYTYSLESGTRLKNDTVAFDQRYKTVRETGSDSYKPGLATLLHVRFKVAPGFSIGLSGGTTLVADAKSIVQYHVGPSLLLGKQQRMVLTAGKSWGYVARAAPGYTDGQRLPYAATAVPTQPRFLSSFMVGLTYNLSGKLKKQDVYAPSSGDSSDSEPKPADK